MVFGLWKYYRDKRYQNPMFMEQAHSLNYKFIQCKDKLIDRCFEEELLCYLYTEDLIGLESIPQCISYKENSLESLIRSRLDKSKRIAILIDEEQYKTGISISQFGGFNGIVLSNSYSLGADKVSSADKLLKDSTIDTVLIEKSQASKCLSVIDWNRTIIIE